MSFANVILRLSRISFFKSISFLLLTVKTQKKHKKRHVFILEKNLVEVCAYANEI